jgi:MFS family permease
MTGVIGVGLSYGCMMSVAPTFTGEFFGKTHFGGTIFTDITSLLINQTGNWALMRVSPGVGSFLCSTVITGQLYQLAIKEEGETQCIGQQCFQLALFIMFGISFICAVATLLIIKRARLFYFKHDAALKEDKSTIAVDPDPHNEDDTPSLS